MAHPERAEPIGESFYMDSIHKVIDNAEDSIQKEMMRTNQHWLQAFTSCVTEIIGYLEMGQDAGEIDQPFMTSATEKLYGLNEKVNKLRPEFQFKNKLVPIEIQQELLHELDVLAPIHSVA